MQDDESVSGTSGCQAVLDTLQVMREKKVYLLSSGG